MVRPRWRWPPPTWPRVFPTGRRRGGHHRRGRCLPARRAPEPGQRQRRSGASRADRRRPRGHRAHVGHDGPAQGCLVHQPAAAGHHHLRPGSDGLTVGGGGRMLASTQFAHVVFQTKLPCTRGWAPHCTCWAVGPPTSSTWWGAGHHVGGRRRPEIALTLRDPRSDERDLSKGKALIVALSPPSPASSRRRPALRRGLSIRHASTESGGVGTGPAFDPPEDEALHTVGRPWPGMGLEIRDEPGWAPPPGEVGEVQTRPWRCRATGNDPEASAEALRDGLALDTTDLGFIDASGCVVLAGRIKEMFIRRVQTRWRSRRCSSSTPACARWPWRPVPTRCGARSASPWCCSTPRPLPRRSTTCVPSPTAAWPATVSPRPSRWSTCSPHRHAEARPPQPRHRVADT